jgi:hypothetical protein
VQSWVENKKTWKLERSFFMLFGWDRNEWIFLLDFREGTYNKKFS